MTLLAGRDSSSLLNHSSFSFGATLTREQLEMDHLLGNFSNEAGNVSNLLAMAGGGLAYRVARSSLLSAGAFRALASLGALGAEVTAFRGATNLFASVRGEPPREAVLDGKGWLGTFVSFVLLKSVGHLAEGQNALVSHALQSSAMVAGNQVTYGLGLSYQPQGSLLEQLLQAETLNLSMIAGNSFLGMATGNRLAMLEGAFDLRDQSISRTRSSSQNPNFWNASFAMEGPALSSGIQPARESDISKPLLMAATNEWVGGRTSFERSPFFQKLSPLFELIRSGASHEEVGEALARAGITLEDVLPHTDFENPDYAKKNYARTPLYNDGKIEALVLGWRPGQYTRVHEHLNAEGGTSCVAEVAIQGEAGEARFEKREGVWTQVQRTRQTVGQVITGADGLYHLIFNAGEGNMITLHIYWPPLDLSKGTTFFRDPFAIPLKLSERARVTEMPGPAAVSGWIRELQEQGVDDIVNLGMGQNGFPPEAHIRQAAAEAALNKPATYGAVQGQPDLIQAIHEKYWPYGLKYDREEIVVSSGGKSSLTFACQALFEAGDSAIILGPAWPSYRDEVRLAGGNPVILLGERETGFRIRPEDLERSIRENPNTKAIILTNPSNPTGVVYTRSELEAFAAIVEKNNLMVIADEIYDGHTYKGEFTPFASLPRMRQRTVTMNGGSKVYSLAGWRVTWLVGPREVIQGVVRLQAHEAANTDTIAQAALNAALRGDQSFIREQVREFESRARVITDRLNRMGLPTTLPEAAFYAFADARSYLDTTAPDGREIKTDVDLARYLLDAAHVAVVPGTYFYAPGNFRLAFGGVDVPQIERAMDRLEAALHDLKPRSSPPPGEEVLPPDLSGERRRAPELAPVVASPFTMLKENLSPYAVPALAIASMWQGLSSGMALAAGLFTALTVGNPYSEQTSKITKPLLAASIVAMGAGLDLHAVASAGLNGFFYTLGGISITLGLGKLLSRVSGLETNQRRMIDGGTAICGGSAIAAIYQALGLKAKDPSVSVALGTVFGLNSLALYLFPWIGHRLNMSQHEFGLWSALSIHDTSSVVGAASSYGREALELATTIKLARALWIMPLVAAMNAWDRRTSSKNNAGPTPAFPKFIFGFLAAAAATTFVPELKPMGDFFAHRAQETMRLTLFLLGANMNLQALRRVGPRPLLHATALWFTMGALSLWGIEEGWIH